MTVYVDDAGIPATVGRHTSRWYHLTADTPAELHQFADALGLRRSWFQADPVGWHYDLTEGKRRQAVALGARPVGLAEMGGILRDRRAAQRSAGDSAGITAAPALTPAPARGPRASAADLDRMAGKAWQAGDLDRCAGLLGLARMAFPGEAARWNAREATVGAAIARRQRQRQAETEAGR
jgi:hypothetical protein